jgi:hypothetical protein
MARPDRKAWPSVSSVVVSLIVSSVFMVGSSRW